MSHDDKDRDKKRKRKKKDKDRPDEPPQPPMPPSDDVPGSVLDLSRWKLTLPTGSKGKPQEVTQPELDSFVHPEWFFARDGRVVFRSRVDGVTTSGSEYPRCELREMTADGKLAAWSLADHHSLALSLAVTVAPPAKPQVVLGQIHGGEDDVLQVLYDGTRRAITYRIIGKSQPAALIENYEMGRRFDLSIEVYSGTVVLSIAGERLATYAASGDGCYWKAGCYVQSNPSKGDEPDAVGEVVVYRLAIDGQTQPIPEEPPVEEPPAPVPTTPPVVVHGNQAQAIRDARSGDVLDFGWERFDQTETIVWPAKTDLTVARAFWVGSTLLPSEPNVWIQGGERLRLVDSVIVGSPDVGKWDYTTGHKQHGLMVGSVRDLDVLRTLIAAVGSDFISLSDKAGLGAEEPGPCEDVLAEDLICIYSRRQGIAPSGIRRMILRRGIITLTQRTILDFESEGGGAHDFTAEECHFDVFSRVPNAVISVGGADRNGVANEGPFILRNNKIYGGTLTVNNRSIGEVRSEGNVENVNPGEFPRLAPLLAQRYPGIPNLAELAGVAER